MPIKDILLVLDSHPVPTPFSAIEKAVELGQWLEAHVTALTFALKIESPVGLYWDPLHLGGAFAEETKKSAAAASELVAGFENLTSQRNVAHGHSVVKGCRPLEVGARIVDHARLHDLTILPHYEKSQVKPEDRIFDIGLQTKNAEAAIFDSGHPVLLLPEQAKRALSGSLEKVMIAWDHSRPAARAVGDALPLLRRAKRVHILTVIGEKPIHTSSGTRLIEHLARHGVEAVLSERAAHGKPIGEVLEGYVIEHGVDLLVMGAYGHSRTREFVLGGATRSVLQRPSVWTLLSH
jgi:nucleotide-binding universal stress UspA family protein